MATGEEVNIVEIEEKLEGLALEGDEVKVGFFVTIMLRSILIPDYVAFSSLPIATRDLDSDL